MKTSNLILSNNYESNELEELASVKFLLKSCSIIKHSSGLFTYGVFALRCIEKLIKIIDTELQKENACKILMPLLQPASLWKESGRWDVMGKELLRLKDRRSSDFILSPTHEELASDVFRKIVTSYKQLPITLYQINTKFRDEIRPRYGLMRAKEFLMMDAYSFHNTDECLTSTYIRLRDAYHAILKKCGVEYAVVSADTGSMGGDFSQEFHVLADVGEDKLCICKSCQSAFNEELWKDGCPNCKHIHYSSKKGIEVGHIFKLGNKYMKNMQIGILQENGKEKFPTMGCYGIGISRLIASIIEQKYTEKGMIWPQAVAPFDIHLVDVVKKDSFIKKVPILYDTLISQGYEVLWDDRRDKNFGRKINDAELIGIPYCIVLGKNFEETGTVEIIARSTGEKEVIDYGSIGSYLQECKHQ